MVKTVSAAICFLVSSSLVSAQPSGWLEVQNFSGKGEGHQEYKGYVRGPIEGKLGWSAFGTTSEQYSQAYGGLTYAPSASMELSLSAGVETADDPLRYAGSLWIGKGRASLLYIYENGGSGPWEALLGTYAVSEKLKIGILSRSYVGTGPYAEVKVGKFLIYTSYLSRDSENQILTGLRVKF